MARQDSRQGGPEESRDARHAYCLKASTAKVDWLCYKRLPKNVFYGELQEGKRSHGDQKKRYKDNLKAPLNDSDIPMGSWEQTAQERSKWRGLINKRAVLYEKRESLKLKTLSAKPMPMGHQRIL